MSEPMADGSAALRGRDRVPRTRPDWAAGEPPPHRRPLPLIVREAVGRPQAAVTAERLAGRSHEWRQDQWPGELAGLRDRAAEIRRETLADLPGYLDRLVTKLTAAGVVVHRVDTARQAADTVARIAREHSVRLVVKSKSMVTEEIGLNARLADDGVDVVETDLGEYIVQLGDERPAHILAPAAHLSRTEIAARFQAAHGAPLPDTPAGLTAFARRRLREDFHHADMAVTGVNFAAADTGTLVLITNEGNARMATSQPPVQVAVMTPEKVVPRLTDISVLVPLASWAGAHQRLSAYQSLLTGPRRPGEPDGPEELHVVIVDNGRSRLLGTKYAEVLACIRCGACQTACPVFRTLGGGHAYGSVYGGPIGAVLTPLLSQRPQDAKLPYLSSLCGACADVCPVKIPLPDMLVDLRADQQTRQATRTERGGWWLWRRLWDSRAGYTATRWAVRAGALLPDRLLRALPGARGWARTRVLPPVRRSGALRRAWSRRSR